MSRSVLRYLLLFVSIFMITNGFAQQNGPIVRVVANKPDNSPKKDQKKEPSKENINHWLNSPQIQEWASKPELQAMIALFTKQIFVVNGRIFGTDDFEPTPYPLQGASIQVKCVGDTSEVHGAVTNDEGEFLIPIFLRQKLKSDFNYSRRFGYELASANRSEYLWNASLEYRFLGIVTAALEWRDILKSRRGFNASTSSTGWSETQQYGNTSMVLLRLGVKLFK